MRSAWYASTQVDTMAHRQRLSPGFTPGGGSRTFAPAKNRLLLCQGGKVMLQHDGKMVSTKQ